MVCVEAEHKDSKVEDEKNDVNATGVRTPLEGRRQTFFQVSEIEEASSGDVSVGRLRIQTDAFFDQNSGKNSEQSEPDGNAKVEIIIFITLVKFPSQRRSNNVTGGKDAIQNA